MNIFDFGNIHLYFAIILALLNGVSMIFLSNKFLQVFQQAGYKVKGYNAWLRGTKFRNVIDLFFICLIGTFFSLIVNGFLIFLVLTLFFHILQLYYIFSF